MSIFVKLNSFWAALIVLVLISFGCSSPSVRTEVFRNTYSSELGIPKGKPVEGLEYYLPKVNMLMDFTRVPLKKDDAEKKAKAAKDAKTAFEAALKKVKEAKAAVKEKTKEVDAAKKDAQGKPDGSPERKSLIDLQKKQAELVAKQKAAEKSAEEAKKLMKIAALASDVAAAQEYILNKKISKAQEAVEPYKKALDKAIETLNIDQVNFDNQEKVVEKLAQAAKGKPDGSDEVKNLKKEQKKLKIFDSNLKASIALNESAHENWNEKNQVLLSAMAEKDAIRYQDNLTIKTLPASADTTTLFIAELDHSSFRTDDLKISTTKEGLLQSANASIEDKSADIIVRLAKIAIAAFKVAAGVPGVSTEDQNLKKSVAPTPTERFCFSGTKKDGKELDYEPKNLSSFYRKKPEKIKIEFDPGNLEEVAKINKMLCQLDAALEINILPEKGHNLDYEKEKGSQENDKQNPFHVDGLLYRRPIAYTAEVRQVLQATKNDYDRYPIQKTTIMLPNNGPIASLPFKSGACVKNTYGVTFINGMPTKRDQNRPSEVYDCLEAPLLVLQEIIKLPTELLQMKVNYSSEQEKLLQSQKNVLDSQKAMMESQKAINAAATEASAAQPMVP